MDKNHLKIRLIKKKICSKKEFFFLIVLLSIICLPMANIGIGMEKKTKTISNDVLCTSKTTAWALQGTVISNALDTQISHKMVSDGAAHYRII